MPLSIDIDNTTLEILATKLKHVVTPLDIIKWLSNFEKEEVELAKDILSNLTVYTISEIEEILNEGFVKIFGNKIADGNKLVVNAVGEFGKSGSMIAYFFQKTSFYKDKDNNKSITLVSNLADFDVDGVSTYSIVMLDDFVGSGNSIRDYYNENQEILSNFENIYYVGVAGMLKGVENIRPLFARTIIPKSNIFKKAFAPDASFFGYRKHVPYRDLAYKYGINLSPKRKIIGNVKRYIEALGYENSQALVSFAYGSPNNTLPIIWANKNGWFPLIPRFSPDRISSSRRLRKDISYELSILSEFGSYNLRDAFFSFKVQRGKKLFSSVSSTDFSLYAIIKLSRIGFLPVSICQKLGILYSDYEAYLQNGKEKGIFEDDNNLSLLGLTLYEDAKKCIAKNKKRLEYNNNESYKIRNIKYTPNQFNGKS